VLFLGSLIIVMLLVSPVCHQHYFSLSAVLLMGLIVASWPTGVGEKLGTGMKALLIVNFAATALALLPGWFEIIRDLGIVMYATLALWLFAVTQLWRRSRSMMTTTDALSAPSRAAA